MSELARRLPEFLSRQVRLFKGFAPDSIAQILLHSRLRSFEANEAILRCGEAVDFLGVLVRGKAAVAHAPSYSGHSGHSGLSGDGGLSTGAGARLTAGDIFGEMSVLTGERAVADLVAIERCHALFIPLAVVNRLILAQPQAVTRLARQVVRHARAPEAGHARAAPPPAADTAAVLRLAPAPPGKVLALGFGRERIRFGVLDTQDSALDVKGVIEPGLERARVTLTAGGKTLHTERGPLRREDFFQALFEAMLPLDDRYLFTPFDILAAGHRVVHGGARFTSATVIDAPALADIEKLSVFAPDHQPANLEGIRLAMAFLPGIPHVAVFDTAFHHTLPAYAYLYGLPYAYCEQAGIRRYGFHGSTHRYAALKAAAALQRPLGELQIISCHLDAGASLCAIDHGRSIDTTMGMTPTDGLIMPTRSGSLDPAVMCHLMREGGMDAAALAHLISAEAGMRGISGLSGDIAEIEAAAEAGHHRALLAHKAFCYQIRKNIGALVAAMNGVDALVFSGAIGETRPLVRSLACQRLDYMGIALDEARNRAPDIAHGCATLSSAASAVKILLVENEYERVLAWETLRAVERNEITLTFQAQQAAPIPVEVSAHHVHLCQADVARLFGAGHQLTPQAELSQPGQFACREKVDLIGPKGRINQVRVLGPARAQTQIEIAMTEQFRLGLQAPVRESGDLANSPGITLAGPAGTAVLAQGVICAQRHIHMPPADALRLRVRDRYVVRVRVSGGRETAFGDVVVRVHPGYRLAMHIDTDEANAAGIQAGATGVIEDVQRRE